MPRTSKTIKKPRSTPDADDIIDLTSDSPSNAVLRLSRSHNMIENTVDSDILSDTSDEGPDNKKQKLVKPSIIIDLDDTIVLDDSSNSLNVNKHVPVLSNSPKKPKLICPICMEDLADENIKAMTTPCGHVYCNECLKTITTSKKKCSICQRAITFKKCIRLHI